MVQNWTPEVSHRRSMNCSKKGRERLEIEKCRKMWSLWSSLPRPLRVHGWTSEIVNPWKHLLCISGPEGEISHTLLVILCSQMHMRLSSSLAVSRLLFVSHLSHELCMLQQFMSLRVRLEAFPTTRVILRALGPGAGVWTQCSSLWLARVLLDLDSCTRRQWAADGRRDNEKNILVKSHLFCTLCRKLANSTGSLVVL